MFIKLGVWRFAAAGPPICEVFSSTDSLTVPALVQPPQWRRLRLAPGREGTIQSVVSVIFHFISAKLKAHHALAVSLNVISSLGAQMFQYYY